MKSLKIIKKNLLVLAFFGAFALSSSLKANEKPNIIIILTDDQGYADIGVNKSVEDIRTPNIDKMANNGVLCSNGYVTAPQCAPSRSGIISGRYQQRFGFDQNGHGPFNSSETTIAQRLKKAGYVTGQVGKWHLEPNFSDRAFLKENHIKFDGPKTKIPEKLIAKHMPNSLGFDEVFTGYINRYYTNYNLDGKKLKGQPTNKDIKGYRLDIQTQAALSFIQRNHKDPFFLYLAYFAPHVPMEATEQYLSRFTGEMPVRRKYCLAMMSAIDDGIGKILEKLEKLKIDDKTIIFYMADNGAPVFLTKPDIDIKFKGGAWDGSLNDPWVGEKGMVSEGAIRVPFVVYYPKHLPKGIVYDKAVISLDASATALALAGIDIKPLQDAKEIDGVNILPFLKGENKQDPHKALFWKFWNQKAVRSGNFKYIYNARGDEYLFDLTTKEHENENLIDKYPEIAKDLRKQSDDWSKDLKNPDFSDEGLNVQELRWYKFYFGK